MDALRRRWEGQFSRWRRKVGGRVTERIPREKTPVNFRRDTNAGILLWLIDFCLLNLFVCEACGTVDYWWGWPEVRLLPPGYLVGVLWLGFCGWWITA